MLPLYITYRVYKGYWEYRAYSNIGAGFSGSRYREMLGDGIQYAQYPKYGGAVKQLKQWLFAHPIIALRQFIQDARKPLFVTISSRHTRELSVSRKRAVNHITAHV